MKDEYQHVRIKTLRESTALEFIGFLDAMKEVYSRFHIFFSTHKEFPREMTAIHFLAKFGTKMIHTRNDFTVADYEKHIPEAKRLQIKKTNLKHAGFVEISGSTTEVLLVFILGFALLVESRKDPKWNIEFDIESNKIEIMEETLLKKRLEVDEKKLQAIKKYYEEGTGLELVLKANFFAPLIKIEEYLENELIDGTVEMVTSR